MTSAPPDQITCPYGHTFPSHQLTTRAGQYVCPVCDATQWSAPHPVRPWSRGLLRAPLVLLAAAVALEAGVQVTTIGLGATYAGQNVGGSAWLLVDAVLSLLGTVAIVVGILALLSPLAARHWARRHLFIPLVVIGAGLAVTGVGGLFGIGLNLSFLDVSSPGATWQLAGEILDALSSLAMGAAAVWIAFLVKTSAES